MLLLRMRGWIRGWLPEQRTASHSMKAEEEPQQTRMRSGTQFTCFTSTEVQILTPEEHLQQFAAYSIRWCHAVWVRGVASGLIH